MVFASFLAVVLLVAAEIYVIVTIAHLIGWALTVALLVASTVAGLWLVRVQGRRAWGALRGAAASGVIPDRELGDAALILAGGALIAVPGPSSMTRLAWMTIVPPLPEPLVLVVTVPADCRSSWSRAMRVTFPASPLPPVEAVTVA